MVICHADLLQFFEYLCAELEQGLAVLPCQLSRHSVLPLHNIEIALASRAESSSSKLPCCTDLVKKQCFRLCFVLPKLPAHRSFCLILIVDWVVRLHPVPSAFNKSISESL